MKYLFVLTLFFLFNCSAQTQSIEEVVASPENPPVILSKTKFTYQWLENFDIENTLVNRIPLPENYERVEVAKSSFGDWLRHFPLKPGKPAVHLYNGQLKNNQNVHVAVLDIDVGSKDLQQCADAAMRLRAEYLLEMNESEEIAFNFTSGDRCSYSKWKEGYRPVIQGNNVEFELSKSPDYSYAEFRNYMEMIFTYCGTLSLSRELESKPNIDAIEIGDLFLYGASPGHTVIVMDVAQSLDSNEKIFLLAQSYMPAQEMHLLKNFNSNALSPWFSTNFVEQLNTPEWTFQKNELKHF